MRTSLRKIGNSQGILIPKPMLIQAGLEDEIEIEIEDGALVLRAARPANPRAAWADSAKALAASGDDTEVWPAFGNTADADLKW